MNQNLSSLSGFVTKLDAEILKEDEAVMLTGGFVSPSFAVVDINIGCRPSNANCSCGPEKITNNEK